MATPPAPWTKHMLDVLGDGHWHHRDDLIDDAAKTVPPGRAFRAGENDRNRKRTDGPGPRTVGDDSDSIAAGAHRITVQALRGLVRFGTVEHRNGHYRIPKKKTTKQGATRT